MVGVKAEELFGMAKKPHHRSYVALLLLRRRGMRWSEAAKLLFAWANGEAKVPRSVSRHLSPEDVLYHGGPRVLYSRAIGWLRSKGLLPRARRARVPKWARRLILEEAVRAYIRGDEEAVRRAVRLLTDFGKALGLPRF